MARCRLVLTDSRVVQEEAPSLGKPVLVMRDTTERPEGVAAGTAILTGPNVPAIVAHATTLLTDEAASRYMADAAVFRPGGAIPALSQKIRLQQLRQMEQRRDCSAARPPPGPAKGRKWPAGLGAGALPARDALHEGAARRPNLQTYKDHTSLASPHRGVPRPKARAMVSASITALPLSSIF